jgi:hypothetical protein
MYAARSAVNGSRAKGQLLRIPQLRIWKLEINRPSTALKTT